MPKELDLFNSMKKTQDLRKKSLPKPVPKIDPLDEIHKTWQKAQTPENMGSIIKGLNSTIDSAMTNFAGSQNPVLRARAKKIAIDAVRTYQPKEGATLKSWVNMNLQGLQRYANTMSPIQVPERIRLDASRVYRSTQEHINEHGREPTDLELEYITGLPTKRIDKVRRMSAPVLAEGQFTGESGEDEEGSYLPGTQRSDWQNVWAEYVYNDLDPINQRIYDMRLGRGKYKGKPMEVQDIAKALGVSPAAISQRSNKISEMLRKGQELDGQL